MTNKHSDNYWEQFRKGVIGGDLHFSNEYGDHRVIYADWIASGRLYEPIERALTYEVGSVVANPHSYSSYTGAKITAMYQEAREVIRQHVNANADDILVTTGSGMTDALIRFQDIIGFRTGTAKKRIIDRPVVFISHMEHHSNHVSWMETIADVVVLPPCINNLVSLDELKKQLKIYDDRKLKIGAFSACSNVTGIINPIHDLAEIMHEHGGYCFADYAASAPYVAIDMHPENPKRDLDAIFFSPHKFLGGPGSCGVLVFNKTLHSGMPSIPGGGNVKWTTPWGDYGYTSDIEAQEDGGTPAFLQTIKASMAIRLKEEMGVKNIAKRENEMLVRTILELQQIEDVELVDYNFDTDRIGAVAFNIKGLHYNLVVRLLNDRYGIQVRGGWSCAGTYAHYLFDIDQYESMHVMRMINEGNASCKPGWVRLSLHPVMTDEEVDFCIEAIGEIALYGSSWRRNYAYNATTNEFDKVDRPVENCQIKESEKLTI